jgi:UDP-N-acetylmuramoylalanine--D-glutamate ligase
LDHYCNAGSVRPGDFEVAVTAALDQLEKNTHDGKVSVIVGLGETGLSCARYLQKKGESFVVVDSRQDPPGLARLRAECPAVKVELGAFRQATLANASRLIVSPGISLGETAIATAVGAGVPVTGDIDIFSRAVTAPIVAVTGSNGKSTVVSLVAEICRQAGIAFGLGGNLEAEGAVPALDLLEEPDRDLYILELSSFQLETTSNLGAEVVVILNFSEDHMDRYEGLGDYLHAKQRIFNGARKVVVNLDSEFSEPPGSVTGEVLKFGLREPRPATFGVRMIAGEEWLAYGDSNLLPVSSLKVAGQHNIANVLAAMAIGKALDIELDLMVEAVQKFAGLPHRCQWVAEVDGVNFYNDSKGTNVGAAVAAIEGLGQSMRGKLVLIAGGVGKGADFSPLRAAVRKHVSAVVVLGSAGQELAGILSDLGPVLFAADMQDAVVKARTASRPGDAVLLSPACASFDMFRDFKHRGEEFINQVRRLR